MSPHRSTRSPTSPVRPLTGWALFALGAVLTALNLGIIAFVLWRASPRTAALSFWTMGTLALTAGLLTLVWVLCNMSRQGIGPAARPSEGADPANESPSRKFANRLLLRSSLESGKCVCLAAGIDDFERLAERHGPTVAEATLSAVGQALDANLRTSDIVGRVGDGVFAVVMPATTSDGARITADRIRVAVSQLEVPVSPGQTLQLSLSLGLCTLRPEDSVESLLDRSCRALAEARAHEPGSLKIM